MWTEKEFEKLEESEHDTFIDEFDLMVLLLADCKDDIISEISNFYRKYGKDGVVTYAEARKYVSEKDHRRRMAVLFLLIGDLLTNFIDDVSVIGFNLMDEIINKETKFFDLEFSKDDFNRKAWGTDDLDWTERLNANKERWLIYLENDLKQSFVRGRKLDDVVKQLERRFGTIENVMERLFGTETTAMSSMTRRELFKLMGIKRYQFFTRADERTCEVCGSMHGMIFPITQYEVGTTAPCIHPNCRCWTVPVD